MIIQQNTIQMGTKVVFTTKPTERIRILVLILTLCFGFLPPAAQSQELSSGCSPPPITEPTLPEKIPGYTELDPETQLHVTGTAQVIDLQTYTLEITGAVERPLSLNYDDLRCLPKIETLALLVCPGFFEDNATWAGASLQAVLERAGIKQGATHIRLVSADGYASLVEIKEASSGRNFLAYEWEKQPIPILHGFPIRAVFPDLQGNKWVKWLVSIEVQ